MSEEQKIQEEEKVYVQRLMRIRCSCGSKDNYINIPTDHGVVVGDEQQPLMNGNDHIVGEHVIHFGNCNSDKNPERQFRKKLVEIALGGSFVGGMITDALEDIGIMSFPCTPKIDGCWKHVNEKHILDGAPVLTMQSTLTCRYEGVITLVPLNEYEQQEQQGENGQGTEQEADRTVQEESAEVISAAIDRIIATGAEQPAETRQAQLTMIAAAGQNAEAALSACQSLAAECNVAREAFWERAFCCSSEVWEENYAYNGNLLFEGEWLDEGGRITNQEEVGHYRMNHFSVQTVGSGAVATYNTMKLLEPESETSFADVIYDLEPYGILNSTCGLTTCGMGDYLAKRGYVVNYETEDMEQKALEADAGILFKVCGTQAHCTAVCRDLKGEELIYYNDRTYGEEEQTVSIMITVNKKEEETCITPMKQY